MVKIGCYCHSISILLHFAFFFFFFNRLRSFILLFLRIDNNANRQLIFIYKIKKNANCLKKQKKT